MFKRTRLSLTGRLCISLLVGLTFLSVLLAALLYGYARRSLRKEFDDNLQAKAKALASLVKDLGSGRLDFDFADEFMPEFSGSSSGEYFQIWHANGKILERSRSLANQNLPQITGTMEQPNFRSIRLSNGREARAVGIKFIPHPDLEDASERPKAPEQQPAGSEPAILVFARDKRPLERITETLAGLLAAGALLLPLSAVGLVYFTVRRELKPIRHLSDQVEAIGPESLSARIQNDDLPLELQPIAAGTNQLLNRLDAAFERERRFSRDVSHELKTPLAEAMSALSVSLEWPRDNKLLVESADQAMNSLRRMQMLTAKLLELSRSHNSTMRHQLSKVELGPLVSEIAEEMKPSAHGREINIELNENAHSIDVWSERTLASSIIRNLIGNAIAYSPAGHQVLINIDSSKNSATVSVINHAPGLTAQEVSEMFAPFWRKDEARADSASHSGLGLSIADSFARILGCKIEAQLIEPEKLRMSVVWDSTRLVFPFAEV